MTLRRFWKHFFKLYPTATDKELAYYVEGNALEPINGDYLYSELVNPVFMADGDNVKVKVAVEIQLTIRQRRHRYHSMS